MSAASEAGARIPWRAGAWTVDRASVGADAAGDDGERGMRSAFSICTQLGDRLRHPSTISGRPCVRRAVRVIA